MIAVQVRKGRWADSAKLLAAARAAEGAGGVAQAACFMATPANLAEAREMGLWDEALAAAGPDDIVIVVGGPEAAAGLHAPCLVRLKLFTLDNRLIVKNIGRLVAADRQQVTGKLQTYLPW